MRILVTGGLGYVGSNVVKYLSALGHLVVVGSARVDDEKISEINLTEFQNFRQGKYILHVLQKGKPFVTSIVKE